MYRVTTHAFHGNVAIRRLTLAGASLRGNIGEKFKGIPGFIGQTEHDNVVLAGNVDIDNLGGIPGVRAPVAPGVRSLAAPVLVKARVIAPSVLTVLTRGHDNIASPPGPDLAVRAPARANDRAVNIAIARAVAETVPPDSAFRLQRSCSTAGIDSGSVRLTVRAASTHGTVSIASIPAAPLARPPAR